MIIINEVLNQYRYSIPVSRNPYDYVKQLIAGYTIHVSEDEIEVWNFTQTMEYFCWSHKPVGDMSDMDSFCFYLTPEEFTAFMNFIETLGKQYTIRTGE